MTPHRLSQVAYRALRPCVAIAMLLAPAGVALAQYDGRRGPDGYGAPGYGQSERPQEFRRDFERRGREGGTGRERYPRDDAFRGPREGERMQRERPEDWRRGEDRQRQQRGDRPHPHDWSDRPRRPPPGAGPERRPDYYPDHRPRPWQPRPYPYPHRPHGYDPDWRPAYPPPPPVYDGHIEDIDAPPPRRPALRPRPERVTAPPPPPRRPPTPQPAAPAPPPRADSGAPPQGETRMAPSEVVVTIASADPRLGQNLARAERLQLVKAQPLALTGVTMARYRIPDRRSVRDVILKLERDSRVLSAQPNYLYTLNAGASAASKPASASEAHDMQPASPQGAGASAGSAANPSEGASQGAPAQQASAGGALAASQYGLARVRAGVAHVSVRGDGVLTAVIDSGVDAGHRELRGAIVRSVDVAAAAADAAGKAAGAAKARAEAASPKPDAHGTTIAGVIAARDQMRGVAPAAQILALRAFETGESGARSGAYGSTFAILLALDEAVTANARVVNMSFAGPRDPLLSKALAAADAKGVVLVAAAGNGGPEAPPAFPAADAHVIAVVATNAGDERVASSARGAHVAIAAPGADIIGPKPGDAYQFATGSSLAAAHVSGVAALMLEANPKLTPAALRKILMETAQDLGPAGRDPEFGAGLVDAAKAVAAGKKLAEAPATNSPGAGDMVKGEIVDVRPEPAPN